MWESIKEIIGGGAPIIGGLLGGKAGGAVGELIASALGVDNSPESIEKALKNNPEAMIKLKELENSKEIAILQAQLEDKRIAIEDKRVDNENTELIITEVNKNTADARAMNIGIQTSPSSSDLAKNTAYYIDIVLVIATVILAFTLFGFELPLANKELAYMMFGSLLTLTGTVVNFHRGSSQSSSDKQVEINKLKK